MTREGVKTRVTSHFKTFFIMGLLMKPDIDSDISLSAVTDVFSILRDVAMCCITVGFNCVSIEGHQYGPWFIL